MKTQLSTLLTALLLLTSVSLSARQAAPQQGGDTLTFTFAPGADLFILRGNEAELERLSSLIDRHRDAITARRMPLCSLAAVLCLMCCVAHTDDADVIVGFPRGATPADGANFRILFKNYQYAPYIDWNRASSL